MSETFFSKAELEEFDAMCYDHEHEMEMAISNKKIHSKKQRADLKKHYDFVRRLHKRVWAIQKIKAKKQVGEK
jgi:hypothetical protein